MSTGMPELGSKISLISKADIRYEGRLFTVDPQECTIALSAVRSFGTEERETQCPIPAQAQVYDYILFRGSDIKDIRVLNSVPAQATLNDPAIMQLSVPPTLAAAQQQFQAHPVVGHVVQPMGFGYVPSGLAPGMQRAPTQPKPNMIGGAASRSTTPISLTSHKSNTIDQGTQAGRAKKAAPNKAGPSNQQQRSAQRRRSSERKNSRERRESNQDRGNHHHDYRNNQHQQQQQQQQNNYRNYAQAGGGGQKRPPWNAPRGQMRARGRPRGGAGGFKPNQAGGGGGGAGGKANTLKFDNDYDFEQANTEFEELRHQLAKAKIDEGGAPAVQPPVTEPAPPPADAATPTTVVPEDKKDDSGNETGAGETEQEEDQEVFYDKKKSFFDKISCEAVERAKGKSQRTDWRTERKLNTETFGVAASRRGNFRSRGGFRGGYRGGFRSGYRPAQQQQQRHDGQNGASAKGPSRQGKRAHFNFRDKPGYEATLKGVLAAEETLKDLFKGKPAFEKKPDFEESAVEDLDEVYKGERAVVDGEKAADAVAERLKPDGGAADHYDSDETQPASSPELAEESK